MVYRYGVRTHRNRDFRRGTPIRQGIRRVLYSRRLSRRAYPRFRRKPFQSGKCPDVGLVLSSAGQDRKAGGAMFCSCRRVGYPCYQR